MEQIVKASAPLLVAFDEILLDVHSPRFVRHGVDADAVCALRNKLFQFCTAHPCNCQVGRVADG